jgi:chromate transporter
VVGAMAATAWLLGSASNMADGSPDPRAPAFWALSAVAALVVWRTQVHLLVLLAAGAAAGLLLSFSPA